MIFSSSIKQLLLTPDEMARADALTIAAGTPGIKLMQAAGAAIAREITRRWLPRQVVVLCGPGNNGGDGYFVARLLAELDWPVRVAALGCPSTLKGDAALAAGTWQGSVEALSAEALDGAELVVDAIFGAGLSRPVDGVAREVLERMIEPGVPIVAVDVPSGLDGVSGQVRGFAARADLTVTFFRRKPGHLLLPGRELCGETVVADIGIKPEVLETIGPKTIRNDPDNWLPWLPNTEMSGHKYSRGHCIVASGPATATGAARLAANSALRAGAGLVTVASPPDALAENASHLTAIMLREAGTAVELGKMLGDGRITSCVIGPGAGACDETAEKVLTVLQAGCAAVLDADALTSFLDRPDALFSAIKATAGRGVILTPHGGEFARLFADLSDMQDGKCEAARIASVRSGAIVILKGADTVIAEPGGFAAINDNAPATLATAGSGDVLAGLTGGLLAQGMPAFEAACAGVWIHGAAGQLGGRGLAADDLPRLAGEAISSLQNAVLPTGVA